jgi:hypothetical protein
MAKRKFTRQIKRRSIYKFRNNKNRYNSRSRKRRGGGEYDYDWKTGTGEELYDEYGYREGEGEGEREGHLTSGILHNQYQQECPKSWFGYKNSSTHCKNLETAFQSEIKSKNDNNEYHGYQNVPTNTLNNFDCNFDNIDELNIKTLDNIKTRCCKKSRYSFTSSKCKKLDSVIKKKKKECNPNDPDLNNRYKNCCPKSWFGRKNSSKLCRDIQDDINQQEYAERYNQQN